MNALWWQLWPNQQKMLKHMFKNRGVSLMSWILPLCGFLPVDSDSVIRVITPFLLVSFEISGHSESSLPWSSSPRAPDCLWEALPHPILHLWTLSGGGLPSQVTWSPLWLIFTPYPYRVGDGITKLWLQDHRPVSTTLKTVGWWEDQSLNAH